MPPRTASRSASKGGSVKPSSKTASKPASKAKSASAKPASKKASKAEEESEEEQEEKKKPASKPKAAAKKDDKKAAPKKAAAAPKKAAPKKETAKKATAAKKAAPKAAAASKKRKAKTPEPESEDEEEEAEDEEKEEVESEGEEEEKKEEEKEEEKEEDKPEASAAASKKRNGHAAELPKKVAPIKRRRITKRVNELPLPVPHGYSVFVWGTGDMGQFGLGPDDLDEKGRPQLHTWFEEQREDGELGPSEDQGGIETLAAGGMHTLAIDQKGQVRSWGINDGAALGRITATNPDPNNPGRFLPNDEFESWPFVVEELKKEGFRAVKVAAGDSVSVAVSDKGDVRAWGSFRSNDGLLGFDGVPGHKPVQFTPIELPALAKVEVVDVACGADHVLALTSEGHVYVWGDGGQNQLGRRVMERRRLNALEPERLGLRNIVHVGAGQYHSFAVDKDGVVYAWGLNTFHQTGITGRDADEQTIIRPQVVEALHPKKHNGAKVVQIDGGEHHSLFLFDNGELWGCGRCDADELGLAKDHPAQLGLKQRRDEIKAEKEQKVRTAKARLEEVKGHAMPNRNLVQKAEEELAEAEAAVPLPPDEFVPEPVLIPFPPIPEQYEVVPEMPPYDKLASNPIAQISAGTRHNLAVSRSGHTYSWGLGNQAQLGLGSAETASVPSLVRSKYLRPYDAVMAAAGGQHCVLLGKKRDA